MCISTHGWRGADVISPPAQSVHVLAWFVQLQAAHMQMESLQMFSPSVCEAVSAKSWGFGANAVRAYRSCLVLALSKPLPY